MIPRAIEREHIFQAVAEIDREGVPATRRSRKFCLRLAGEDYPPKYVVSLAAKLATGEELPPESFGGGAETNTFLARLGFEIVDRDGAPVAVPEARRKSDTSCGPEPRASAQTRRPRKTPSRARDASHSEHCDKCKDRIEQLLKFLYGSVVRNWKSGLPARPEKLSDGPAAEALRRIYRELTELRGHENLVGQDQLPPCDYFVPSPGFVVEVDERQHFTAPRRASLKNYGSPARFGFSVRRWAQLCERIDAHDNDPPHRDEQRAWYDTLRDHLHLLLPSKVACPTVRIFAGDHRWCGLEPTNPEDQAFFADWCGLPFRFSVEHRLPEEAPYWGRVILCGPWYGGVVQARRVLEAVCNHWPAGLRTRVLLTCGGFVSFQWPEDVDRANIGDNLSPAEAAVDRLLEEADSAVRELLAEPLRSKLAARTDAVSLGVDSFKSRVSTTSERIRQLHVELVCFINFNTDTRHWTSKFYPTVGQERGLVRAAKIDSHFLEFNDETVLLLGCHDLNLFNPRGNSTVKKPWRKEAIQRFQCAVTCRRPAVVVHHPHATDSPRIWGPAINKLLCIAGSPDRFASAGRYHNQAGRPRVCLTRVLDATVKGHTADFIVCPDPP